MIHHDEHGTARSGVAQAHADGRVLEPLRPSIRRTHGEPGRGNLADVALTGELDEKRNTPEMTQDTYVRGRPRENLDETLGPDIETHEDIER